MHAALLTINGGALAGNWRALAQMGATEGVETAAVVKADGYGLGATRVARRLYEAGARTFFVAQATEGKALRPDLPGDARIFVLQGHMQGADLHGLIPVLNSVAQFTRDRQARPTEPFAIQLDTGMNRLGLEPAEWAAIKDEALAAGPALVMSHLACADEPQHPMNGQQLAAFRSMTEGVRAPRSLAATGGILLGPAYHFDMLRPGIGLYGGLPFDDAQPVLRLRLPVIQTRMIAPGEAVGYGNSWTATAPTRIATVSAGYADGLLRAMSSDGVRPRLSLYAGKSACPLVGRVSMDLITADVTHLDETPEALDIIGPEQSVDAVAHACGTIGYEVLTALGHRYQREWI